jgi:hypothetical protein
MLQRPNRPPPWLPDKAVLAGVGAQLGAGVQAELGS